jgi:hypothetical protein
MLRGEKKMFFFNFPLKIVLQKTETGFNNKAPGTSDLSDLIKFGLIPLFMSSRFLSPFNLIAQATTNEIV